MFEGEFTSVVAQAACKDWGATGSTAWGFNEKNIRLLASCEKVLICFDADKNQAGDKASKRWLDRLSNAVRWRPLWDDANDMAMDGVDVGAWLALGFEEHEQDMLPVSQVPQIDGDLPVSLCYTCLDEDLETPADGEYDGIMYCSKHLPACPQLSQDLEFRLI